jgi:hypothetical protein
MVLVLVLIIMVCLGPIFLLGKVEQLLFIKMPMFLTGAFQMCNLITGCLICMESAGKISLMLYVKPGV